MSDESALDAVDTATLLESIDLADLLETTDLDELAEREDFGVAVEEFGATLGREIGAALGREIGGVLATAITERPSFDRLVENVKAAIGDALRSLLVDPDSRMALREDIQTIVERKVSGELTDDTEDSGNGETGGEVDGAEKGDEGEADETAGGEENEKRDGEGTESERGEDEETEEESEPSSREELEEFSYRELQSLAKEHDIKANLSRDEMTDQLIAELDIEE